MLDKLLTFTYLISSIVPLLNPYIFCSFAPPRNILVPQLRSNLNFALIFHIFYSLIFQHALPYLGCHLSFFQVKFLSALIDLVFIYTIVFETYFIGKLCMGLTLKLLLQIWTFRFASLNFHHHEVLKISYHILLIGQT